MVKAKRIGRGTNVRHTATRMTVSVAVATVVTAATVMPARESTMSPDVRLAASTVCMGTAGSTCALIMGGTSIPTPDDYYIDTVISQYIAPTHPGQIEAATVTTPEELWPVTGLLFRLPGFVLGPREIWGLGGPGWPDEPWWRLTGLFDLTIDQSLRAGVADLEDAMADQPNDQLVIYGYSQGAMVANLEKRKLAEQYPVEAPDIDFVLSGDPNLPNGGFAARFPGLYVPILDVSFNGPAPTGTQFDTVEINRQYDGISDFPLYPLNVISLLNALLGVFYVHFHDFDVSLLSDPLTSPRIVSQHGDTTYYFFETSDLPLFGPLRTLGVPEPVIDVFEPFVREVVELGYDRSIQPWEPTPARLIPLHDPATVAKDLVDAIGEGIANAAALIGAPAPLGIPAVQATDNTDRDTAVEQRRPAPGTTLKSIIDDVNHFVAQGSSTVRSRLPVSPAATRDNLDASLRAPDQTRGAVKSVIGDGRTIIGSAFNDNGSPAATTTAHKTPLRDAVKNAHNDIKKVVTKVSDSIKKALSGGKHGDDGVGGTSEPAP